MSIVAKDGDYIHGRPKQKQKDSQNNFPPRHSDWKLGLEARIPFSRLLFYFFGERERERERERGREDEEKNEGEEEEISMSGENEAQAPRR